jgi:hypothetical protein
LDKLSSYEAKKLGARVLNSYRDSLASNGTNKQPGSERQEALVDDFQIVKSFFDKEGFKEVELLSLELPLNDQPA